MIVKDRARESAKESDLELIELSSLHDFIDTVVQPTTAEEVILGELRFHESSKTNNELWSKKFEY